MLFYLCDLIFRLKSLEWDILTELTVSRGYMYVYLLIKGLILSASFNSFRCHITRSTLFTLNTTRISKPITILKNNLKYLYPYAFISPMSITMQVQYIYTHYLLC